MTRDYRYGDVNHVSKPGDYVAKGANSSRFKHGLHNHPLYKTWHGMMDRCYNEKNQSYPRYGGRGILVAKEWHDISKFIEDMGGSKPYGFSLERLDNEKGYSKHNCVWANVTKQSRNRSFTKLTIKDAREIRALPRRAKNGRGDGFTRKQIADIYGVSVATIKKVLSMSYWKEESEKITPAVMEKVGK